MAKKATKKTASKKTTAKKEEDKKPDFLKGKRPSSGVDQKKVKK